MPCHCLRWSLNLRNMAPIGEQVYTQALQSIQNEEYERICKFHFNHDHISSLVGRLMLRAAAVKLCGTNWKHVRFGRTDRGKPYLVQPADAPFSINVSHQVGAESLDWALNLEQGDYVLLATSCTTSVGVDVMHVHLPTKYTRSIDYINFMQRSNTLSQCVASGQFSPSELTTMRSLPNDKEQMTMFYRFWCLKESVIKATGEGIHKDLAALDFRVNPENTLLDTSHVIGDSILYEDGHANEAWAFDEARLDADHVCAKIKPAECTRTRVQFTPVTIVGLLRDAVCINDVDDQEMFDIWKKFRCLPNKPNHCDILCTK